MGGKSKTTSETKIDPVVQQMQFDNFNRAKGIADRPVTPYGGDPLDLSQSMEAAQGLSGFYAPDISAASYNPTLMNRGDIRNITTAAATPGELANYYNPYEQQVVDSTRADMERARQIAQTQNQGAVAARGAFGNSRRGIYEAEIDGASQRNLGSVLGGLRSQGFNTALGAVQGDQNRRLAADTTNAGYDFGVASGNAGFSNQAGQFNAAQAQAAQEANQRASIAGAGVRASGAGLLGSLQQTQYGSAYDEFLRQQNDPLVKQGLLNASLGGVQAGQTTTGTKTPGMFDWVNMGAQTAAAYFGGRK